MWWFTRSFWVLVLIGVCLYATPAEGEGQYTPQARARHELSVAQTKFDNGEYEEAQRLFEKSAQLHASAAAWLGIAKCQRKQGRLASALVALGIAEGLAITKTDRENVQRYGEAVLAAVSTVTIRVHEPSRNVRVSLDGVVVDDKDFGAERHVDGGTHIVRADLPNRTPFRISVDMAPEDDHKVVDVPPLEPLSDEGAVAQALFEQGRDLMTQGNVSAACERFKESFRLDPGWGTAGNLGLCHERLGRTASAERWYQTTAHLARRDGSRDGVDLAMRKIADLESRLSYVIPATSYSVEQVISIDGIPLPEAMWGVPVPVDPGRVVISVEAQGAMPWSSTVVVKEGETVSVEIPVLEPSRAAASPPIRRPSQPGESSENIAATFVPGPTLTLGITAVGLGGANLGLSVAQYLRASDRESSEGKQSLRVRSAVFGGLGASLVATGAVLIGRARPQAAADARHTTVGPLVVGGGGGVVVEGSW